MTVEPRYPTLALDAHHLDLLVGIAETAIAVALVEQTRWSPVVSDYETELALPGAVFVTLQRAGALLGCVGTLQQGPRLVEVVAERALAAAFGDPRFPGIDASDFEAMSIDVSVLTPLEHLPVTSRRELVGSLAPARPGVYITAGSLGATFLPKVWEHLATPERFLDALWAKAGLPRDAWPAELRVWCYEAVVATGVPPRSLRAAATDARRRPGVPQRR